MPKREWGTKRLCVGCGDRYYDLQRNPITCPRCGEAYVPEPPPKSRRAATTKPKIAVVAPARTITLSVVPDLEDAVSDKTDGDKNLVDIDADGDGDGDVIEDPSELGEDEDDMAEVIEGSREDKQD